MTMLVATPQATTHSNTAVAPVDVPRATWPAHFTPAPAVTKLNTHARPIIACWSDPNTLRGL
jgi:hypothetical protein